MLSPWLIFNLAFSQNQSSGITSSNLGTTTSQNVNSNSVGSVVNPTGFLAPSKLGDGTQLNLKLDGGKLTQSDDTVIKSEQIKNTSNVLKSVETANQYQLFVKETTGKGLPIYGHNLFGGANFAPIATTPVQAGYMLASGDEIDIKVWGAVDYNIKQVIDNEGRISVPKIGMISLVGIKVDKLEEVLQKHFSRIFNNFEISASVSRTRPITVYAVGHAKQLGSFIVSGQSTLISALFEIGGPSVKGSMRYIKLLRQGREVASIDLYNFIRDGDTSKDVRLLAGDVISIPPVGPQVALIGAIDNQAIYELKNQDESLNSVLSISGEKPTLISPFKLIIERIDKNNPKGNRSVEEKALDADGLKTTLKDGDIVTLFKVNSQYTNTVSLRGNVASPLRYKHFLGMRVSDLIPESSALIESNYYTKKNLEVMYEAPVGIEQKVNEIKALLNQINWNYAVIERLDRTELRTKLIPFDLEKAVKNKDPEHDIVLQSGDTVTIFNSNDIALPIGKKSIMVKITGEVNAAGYYQINQGEKFVSLISKAGDLTKDAFIPGIIFNRESIRLQQQKNLEVATSKLEKEIIRRLTSSQVNSTATSSITSTGVSAAGVANFALMEAQKQYLERLKTVKASGRVSLGLNGLNDTLPDIQLEDGDEIIVPFKPDFVGVFGSVMYDTNFIYDPKLTVRDYLNKAGLSKDADLDGLMIIKANGNIETPERGFSMFSKGMLSRNISRGDTIYVPEDMDLRNFYTNFMIGLKDWTSIMFQFGIGAAALKTLR